MFGRVLRGRHELLVTLASVGTVLHSFTLRLVIDVDHDDPQLGLKTDMEWSSSAKFCKELLKDFGTTSGFVAVPLLGAEEDGSLYRLVRLLWWLL